MRWRWLLSAAAMGCAHASPAPSTATRVLGETAIGAYLDNPLPYLIASLGDCSLSGPVSEDSRATGPGLIEARCEHGISMRWIAVPATSIQIDGPATIRTPSTGLNYIYSVGFMASGKPIGGRSEVEWTTAADCEQRVALSPFNTATIAIPNGAGSCTLQARVLDLRAARTIVAE